MTGRRIPSPRAVWLGVAVAIIISTLGFLNGYLSERTDKESAQQGKAVAVDQATGLADKVLAACNGTGDEAAALRAAELCGSASRTKTKVEAIPGTPGPAGATGPVGPQGPGPTLRQLLQTMQVYCAPRQDCRGPRGQTVVGPAGKDSTVAGPQGTAGSSGKDSTVPGPKGDTGAKGDTGDRGPAGSDGRPGRGITSLGCTGGLSPITFTVTYDDGTSQEFSCGTLPPVEAPSEPAGE